ncbi:winged helix-turn-helix domain-containing protein [Sphingomicrobium arenosum]|uniref:winged helix-turn-helix domain-containing protein n=1 Tax=Sphingomicrobium arenosum TaxID=2233861 RepID=UPI002240F24C|nr:transcriptional regulator [Sphingomicrobium arenosum]
MSEPRAIRFGPFTLEPGEARLLRGDTPIALQPRAFDLLDVLARHPGQLLSKDELLAQVWPGVTVGDEALTQAIKEVRKALGDDAAAPTYIETVRGRGYRFIAPVEGGAATPSSSPTARPISSARAILGGTLGGVVAGLVGGLVYGMIAATGNDAALVIVTVMTVITMGVAGLGALGLLLGMTAASRILARPFGFLALGAALGGFLVGDLFHLLASGSFSLLLATPHADFTGGLEGAVLGAGIAMGAQLGGGVEGRWPRPVLGAGIGGGLAGVLISLGGGKLMAASLLGLARKFHGDAIDGGGLSGLAEGFGTLAQALSAGVEGLLLGSLVTAGILIAQRRHQPILS